MFSDSQKRMIDLITKISPYISISDIKDIVLINDLFNITDEDQEEKQSFKNIPIDSILDKLMEVN